jgi:hypothetical protein
MWGELQGEGRVGRFCQVRTFMREEEEGDGSIACTPIPLASLWDGMKFMSEQGVLCRGYAPTVGHHQALSKLLPIFSLGFPITADCGLRFVWHVFLFSSARAAAYQIGTSRMGPRRIGCRPIGCKPNRVRGESNRRERATRSPTNRRR